MQSKKLIYGLIEKQKSLKLNERFGPLKSKHFQVEHQF